MKRLFVIAGFVSLIYFGLIVLGVFGFLWVTILPFIVGGFDHFSIILYGISLTLASLFSLFLILQVKYWRRRFTELAH